MRLRQALAAVLPFLLAIHQCLVFAEEGFITSAPTTLELSPIFATDTVQYTLSSKPSDAYTAQQICRHHGGDLLSVSSQEELESLQKLLPLASDSTSAFWSSGIIFSNSTVDDLLVWSSSQQPFPFLLAKRDLNDLHLAKTAVGRLAVRKRRSADTDCCPCPTTPQPFIPPVCKRPVCQVTRPTCPDVPRDCEICGPAECSAQEKNCTVECKEKCRIIEQPVCTLIDSDKPRCRLENPDPIDCTISDPPTCRITKPGVCVAKEVTCTQKKEDCVPVIKPCKKACTQQECTTIAPPCTTAEQTCVTSQIPCTTPAPSNDCLKRCRRSALEKEKLHTCELNCVPGMPTECGKNVTVCPSKMANMRVCPPAVTTCTRPFVDCSPIVCASSVYICPPPKIHCPPPAVECTEAEIECDEPTVTCPSPEVICEQPEMQCTKPKIECPDAVVHCSPIVTTCGRPPIQCKDAKVDCPDPVISCGEPIVCPVNPTPSPPPGSTEPPGSCRPCNSCNKNRIQRDIEPMSDDQQLQKIECIALSANNNGDKEAEWVAQSCNLKHRFICKI